MNDYKPRSLWSGDKDFYDSYCHDKYQYEWLVAPSGTLIRQIKCFRQVKTGRWWSSDWEWKECWTQTDPYGACDVEVATAKLMDDSGMDWAAAAVIMEGAGNAEVMDG